MPKTSAAPALKLAIFGLSLSSAWGNGHATLWRALIRALCARGVDVTFFERDAPYYAAHRDFTEAPYGTLILYPDFPTERARAALREADAVIVTSYCPDARRLAPLLSERRGLAVFYDMDAPVTLARLEAGEDVPYLPEGGLGAFDLVLSYAGGETLARLRLRLGARRTAALFGCVDPAAHAPAPRPKARAALSHLGSYAADRADKLAAFFSAPARARPAEAFLLAGPGYDDGFGWAENITWRPHVAPAEHPAFFASARLTLSVARADMAKAGWSPSGRLFEAAACGAPILSDDWPGLSDFYARGREVLIAKTTEDVLAALSLSDAELDRIAQAARARTLSEHTAEVRAETLIKLLDYARRAPAAA